MVTLFSGWIEGWWNCNLTSIRCFKIRCFEVRFYEAFMKIQPKRHLFFFQIFFYHLLASFSTQPSGGYAEFDCTVPLAARATNNQRTTNDNEPTHAGRTGWTFGATEVEVDNWQFAWAEEQKKACCKTVGLESPGKCKKEGGRWRGFQIWMGEECGVILELQKGKNTGDLKKTFACWISFWTKLMEKGDGNPWILVNDSFRVISCSHCYLHSIAVILVLSYWTCLRYRLQGGWGVISRTIRSRQLLRLFQGVGG